MKFRYLLTSILACLALAVGCVQEELPGLKDITVTPSYFTLGVDGGAKDITVKASAWEITDIPEWVTVNPTSGSGEQTVNISVAASKDTLARVAFLKVKSGAETQLVTVNQDAFIPEFPEFKAGDYWIVFDGGAALPLSSAYGYLYTAPVKTDENGAITSTAQNIFTFKAVEGGFTIQDPAGQYYCMQGSYDSFNVYATLPDAGGVWTVKQVASTAYEVVNVANGKRMQYDANYSSAGAYSSERGVNPNLVKVEVVPEPEPLGDSMDIDEAIEYKPELVIEGLVTASSSRGVILSDKSGSILVYGINSEVALGDSIKVSGKLDVYNKGFQLIDPYQYEYVDSVKHEVKYPAAVELTKESLPEMVKSDFLAKYVSVKGIVSVDSYNNALVKVGDYTVKTYYSHDSYANLKDKAYEIKGYLISFNESKMEANLIVTSVSDELTDFVPEPEDPEDNEPVAPETNTLTLTNAEILAAMTSSSYSYVDYTISSASGEWTVNASQYQENTFLQCRGKNGAYIKTPLFEKDIKSVTIHFSEAKSVYENNVYCAFPATWTVPTTEDAAYPEDGNVGRAVTDGSYSLTIPVAEGNKQVYITIIGTYAYYLDHIDVELK